MAFLPLGSQLETWPASGAENQKAYIYNIHGLGHFPTYKA
jgi:hypothetical protein